MINLFTIISYTIKQAIQKKSFIIATIVMMLFIVLVFNIPNVLNVMEKDKDEEDLNSDSTIVISDKNNAFGDYLDLIAKNEALPYKFEVDNTSDIDTLKEKVRNEEVYGLVIISSSQEGISFDYIIKEEGMFAMTSQDAEEIAQLLKNVQINKELDENQVASSSIIAINTPINYNVQQLENSEGNDNFGIAMASAFILFFAVYFYGYSVSSSVSSEKTSRVMETLVTSTNPTSIVIGKTIAMGAVGLIQLLVLILTAVVSYKLFIPENYDVISSFLSNVNITPLSVCVVLVYFILGYTVYAFLNAVTGATVSKAEDVQSANMPVAMISLISFYLAYFTATVPNSGASKFASIFPFSAAFSMPGRILAGAVSTGEIITSIIVLMITSVILAFISIKVYSAAILHYGDRLKLSDLLKMFKQK